MDEVALCGEYGGEGAVALHCVDGVFADVFDDPFEEVGVEGCDDGVVGECGDEVDFARRAFLEVGDGVLDDLCDVLRCEFGCAAYFGEAPCDGVEPVDVFAYFVEVGLCEGFALEVVGPSAE